MLINRNSILFSIVGVLTLIVVLAVQIIPHTSCHADIELSEALDFEDTDSDEKDAEEKFEKKYTQDSKESSLYSLHSKNAHFCFLNCIDSAPTLETISPPPDWI